MARLPRIFVLGLTIGVWSSAPLWSGDVLAAQEAAKGGAVALSQGQFKRIAHEGSGLATIYLLKDGRRVLRLTEFETLNGPDLRVYLFAAEPREQSRSAERKFVDLGKLKGNKGNQNYEIPDGVDLSKFTAVSIWCRRFSVNFAEAPLSAEGSLS